MDSIENTFTFSPVSRSYQTAFLKILETDHSLEAESTLGFCNSIVLSTADFSWRVTDFGFFKNESSNGACFEGFL